MGSPSHINVITPLQSLENIGLVGPQIPTQFLYTYK